MNKKLQITITIAYFYILIIPMPRKFFIQLCRSHSRASITFFFSCPIFSLHNLAMLGPWYFFSLLFCDRVYQMIWTFKVRLYKQKFDDEKVQRQTATFDRYLYYALLTWINCVIEIATFSSHWKLYFFTLPPILDLVCEHHWFRSLSMELQRLTKCIVTGSICLVLVNFFNFLAMHLGSSPDKLVEDDRSRLPQITYTDLSLLWEQLDVKACKNLITFLAMAVCYDIFFSYGPGALFLSFAGAANNILNNNNNNNGKEPTAANIKQQNRDELRNAFAQKNYSFLMSSAAIPKLFSVFNDIEQGWLRNKLFQLFTMLSDWYLLVFAYATLGEVAERIIVSLSTTSATSAYATGFVVKLFLMVLVHFCESSDKSKKSDAVSVDGNLLYLAALSIFPLKPSGLLFSLFLLHPPHFLLHRIHFDKTSAMKYFPLTPQHLLSSVLVALMVQAINFTIAIVNITDYGWNNLFGKMFQILPGLMNTISIAIFCLLHIFVYRCHVLGHFKTLIFGFLTIIGFYSDWTPLTSTSTSTFNDQSFLWPEELEQETAAISKENVKEVKEIKFDKVMHLKHGNNLLKISAVSDIEQQIESALDDDYDDSFAQNISDDSTLSYPKLQNSVVVDYNTSLNFSSNKL